MKIREYVNKQPMLGWGVAAAIAVIAVVVFFFGMRGSETSQLTELVTIRCRETGKEWTMPRGAVEKALMLRAYPVNPEEGLINPDTNRPTGFPVDDWNKTVERINQGRAAGAERANKKQAEKDAQRKPPPK